ncbi:hypothetical protein GYMLUDRAFT_243417 [Collybiopsis luxurians FD-317 M1]|uniref:F-box domain-containing protein n=1 Tax=Collybiopsis luxurians FD-317 M1 TaxID=944289 RepID=A0A0D0CZ17_9AGAR|nr:hypothetical protein GYMLUDRAFT_243417 [Collybiopsis luxurians FD-317 M1]
MNSDRALAGLVLPDPLMPVTTPQIVTQAQFDQIDQEIIKYEDAIRALQSRRNLMAPISKLPAEILCTIFMFCNTPEPVNTYAAVDLRWRWITVTHISRLWRSIAMNCPALWSRPEFTKTEWAYEMIKRSKMAPLTIEVTSNYWLTPRVVDAVSEGLKHLDRINEIRLTASRDNMDKLLSGISQPAPFLRTLYLDIGRSDYYYHSRAEPYTLPHHFLGDGVEEGTRDGTVRLTHIELTRCHLRWDSTLLSNLSYLKVHNPGPPAPTLDQFIGALAKMPQLEILDLENTLPANADTAFSEKPRVNLPRLRKLRVVGALEECAIFLDHVSVPSGATMHIVAKCADAPEQGSESLDLINSVCRRLPVVRDTVANSDSVPVIKSLKVQSLGPGSGVVVEAWNNNQGPKNKFPLITSHSDGPITLNSLVYAHSVGWLRLEFSWHSAAMRQLHNGVVAAACTPLPLSQLKTLHIWTAYHECINSPTFAKTFGTLSKISTLIVQGDSAYELVHALSPHTTVVTADRVSSSFSSLSFAPTRPTPTFPALRTLKLLEADFDRDHEARNTLLDPLKDCLTMRYEFRSEVNKLVLERCTHLTSDDVLELEDIVVDVDWDGLESGFSETEDEDMDDDFDDDPMDYFDEPYFGFGEAYMSPDEDMMFMGF